jgi:phospholipase/carboxylesterase
MTGLLVAGLLALGCGKDSPSKKPDFKTGLPLLKYEQYLVGTDAGSKDLPIVVAVHGYGDYPKRFKLFFSHIETPVRLIMPVAPTPVDDERRRFSWFPVHPFPVDVDKAERHIRRSAKRVAELVVAVRKRYPKSGRPLLAGYSQGAMIVYAITVKYPHLIRAAVPFSGALPKKMWPEKKSDESALPPVRALHGSKDNIVLPGQTRRLIKRLQQVGYDATLREFADAKHKMTPERKKIISKTVEKALSLGR